MSNAMRSGKRTLAAVAAGALGAGMLGFLAAPSAQAAAAASFVTAAPSYSIAVDDWDDDLGLPVGATAFTSAGISPGATLDNQILRISITSSPTAADDTALVLAGTGVVAGSNGQVFESSTTANFANAAVRLEPAATVNGNGGPAGDWSALYDSASPAKNNLGNYTLTYQLINSLNGAVLSTKTVIVSVTTGSGAALPTLVPLNEVGNPMNAVGALRGSTVANGEFGVAMRDARGGPWLSKLTDEATTGVIALTSANSPDLLFDDTDNAVYATTGVYYFDPATADDTWSPVVTRDTLQFTFLQGATPRTQQTNVPVSLATTPFGADVELLTTPSASNAAGTVYEVPTGTTSLRFGIEGVPTSGTQPWNAYLFPAAPATAGAGVATPSGGAVPTDALGNGVINVTVNAAAATDGSFMDLDIPTAGGVLVYWADPEPAFDVNAGLAKVSSAATVSGTITTQFGSALPGTWNVSVHASADQCYTSTPAIATAAAGADGAFTLAIPATAALAAPGTEEFAICASNGFATADASTFDVIYTASGTVNSLDIQSDVAAVGLPVVDTPWQGVINIGWVSTQAAVTDPTKANPNLETVSPKFVVTPTADPAVAVTLSVTEGAYLTTKQSGTLVWSQGKSTVTVAPGTDVTVYATKPGVHTITAKAGESTDTFQFVAGVARYASRVVTAEKTTFQTSTFESFKLSATVTDIYGNKVPDTSLTIEGAGSVIGRNLDGRTDKDGVVSFFFTADEVAGQGTATFRLNDGFFAPEAPPDAPALVRTAVTNVTVVTGTRSIMIVGERTTVGGKPGIRVEGDTTGIASGVKTKPWVRFPGQSEYTVGSARPTVDAAGDFAWQRKTGKKTYVFFTTEDESVKSNRVIIAAN